MATRLDDGYTIFNAVHCKGRLKASQFDFANNSQANVAALLNTTSIASQSLSFYELGTIQFTTENAIVLNSFFKYERCGRSFSFWHPTISGTSGATGSIRIPAGVMPARLMTPNGDHTFVNFTIQNGTNVVGALQFLTDGRIAWFASVALAGFTIAQTFTLQATTYTVLLI